MTTIHRIDLSWIGIGDLGDEQAEMDRLLIRNSAKAATESNAAVFIFEKCTFWGEEDDIPLGAVIPAQLAKQLIAEGRLNPPPIASMTVLA